ncbi:tail fiber protein [Geobacillus thermoleovorans]|uniref:tail fiber protein n=1 Tax=Geobacillus thermoleovorans TaxID=33941 RepID=UPI00345BF487
MASNTPRLNLYKKDPVADANDTFNITTMLNDNWDRIDANVVLVSEKGVANGVASLDANTKVPTSQLPSASTSAAGIVQLNDTVTSTSTTQAATANAVKQVYDAIVSHSAETIDSAHGIKTTSDITLYVDAVNGNDSNPGTQSQPLKTIGAAVSKIKNLVIEHTVTIQLAPGTYTENILIKNLIGSGSFYLKGASDLAGASSYTINGFVSFSGCTCLVFIQGIKVLGTSSFSSAIDFSRCLAGRVYYCKIDRSGTNATTNSYGINIGANSFVFVVNCDISNVTASGIGAAISVFETSRLYSSDNTGSGNSIGLRASAGTIMKNGTQPSGAAAESTNRGGVIR